METILIDLIKRDIDSTDQNYSDEQNLIKYIDSAVYSEDLNNGFGAPYCSLFNEIYKDCCGLIEERIKNFTEIISRIDSRYSNKEPLFIHFLGHGCEDGLEFAQYDFFNEQLSILHKQHHLYINMMSSCFSSGMLQYSQCYNRLWCSKERVRDIYIPFIWDECFLKDEEHSSFNDFLSKSQINNGDYIEYITNQK